MGGLDDICGIYMGQIQETRKNLYGYLKQNPTFVEVRSNVLQLATVLGEELAVEQKANEEFAAMKVSILYCDDSLNVLSSSVCGFLYALMKTIIIIVVETLAFSFIVGIAGP